MALTLEIFDRVLIYPEEPSPLTVEGMTVAARPVVVDWSQELLTYPMEPRPWREDVTFVGVLTYPAEPRPWRVDVRERFRVAVLT
jgi:hypothetical protein